MKKIFASLDLDALAERMADEIKAAWKNPFDPPTVIFADAKMEQWFKLNFLKRSAGAVLMNLKTTRLEAFLREFVKTQCAFPENAEPLSAELLRDIICARLVSKVEDGGKPVPYFETLGKTLDSDAVAKYLRKSDGGESADGAAQINWNNLFDLAQKMAELFLSYEAKRPDGADGKGAGVIKTWLAGGAYFFADGADENRRTESWQRKLYADILGAPIELDGTTYLTLGEQWERAENGRERGAAQPSDGSRANQSVFIFGLGGIGQLHRAILNQVAETGDLYVFQQAGAAPRENEKDGTNAGRRQWQNPLANAWARLGDETLELWLSENQNENQGGAASFEEVPARFQNDTLLHKIQKDIADDRNIQDSYKCDDSLTLTAAPSRLREVEAVHSKICALLKDGKADLDDILVLAPSVEDYRTAIFQVFCQNDHADRTFPHIPFVIADRSSKNSPVAEAFNVAAQIVEKNYFSRADVSALAHNGYVQAARGFSEEDAQAWAGWTVGLNAYRKNRDWQKAKLQLLAAKLSDNKVAARGGLFGGAADEEGGTQAILPYADMDAEDDLSLFKFLDLIDALENLLAAFDCEEVSLERLEKIRAGVENLLLPQGGAPQNLAGDDFAYGNIAEEFGRLEAVMRGADAALGKTCVLLALRRAADGASYSGGRVFAGGVTFSNFSADRIMGAKHVFMLGMDSMSFPGAEGGDMLDLSLLKKIPGDESVIEKNKNAFFRQLLSARDGLFISYVNKDLKKDEDFFKSSVVGELFSRIKGAVETVIPISETRDWGELFTSREFRDKSNFVKLNEGANADNAAEKSDGEQSGQSDNDDAAKLPDKVSVWDLKLYLENPFTWFAKKVLSDDEDDEGAEQTEFEPTEFDALDTSKYTKEYAKRLLSDDSAKSNDAGTLESEKIKKEFEEALAEKNALPDGVFGDEALKKLAEGGGVLAERAREILGSEIEFDEAAGLPLECGLGGGESKSWTLGGRLSWHNGDWAETGMLALLDVNSEGNVFAAYASALALVASEIPASWRGNDKSGETISVSLDSISSDPTKNKKEHKEFALSRRDAVEILNDIYRQMFVEKIRIPIPSSLYGYEKDKKNKAPKKDFSFDEYLKHVEGEQWYSWQYFSKKDLIDLERDIGINEESFDSDFKEAATKHKALLKFLGGQDGK